ncbi:hypothetical protein [Streptosporangium sp. NPDC051022]|uniref:hypothetical protein n=1 Tax=Streptosporangium sp. NPDC051022 TaxID=3155752 RepID=UPI0034135783
MQIRSDLFPTSPGGSVWDGAADVAGVVTERAGLAREALIAAIVEETAGKLKYLDDHYLHIAERERLYKGPDRDEYFMPMTEAETIAEEGRKAVDRVVAKWTSHAALSPEVAAKRAAMTYRASGADRTLFDACDLKDRSLLDPRFGATLTLRFLISGDEHIGGWAREHGFDITPGSQEERFFLTELAPAVLRESGEALVRFGRFAFVGAPENVTDPRLLINTFVWDPDADGRPLSRRDTSPEVVAARQRFRWQFWKRIVHECIHTREHPRFAAARLGTAFDIPLAEGFCEFFTKMVIDEVLATPETYRAGVEESGAAPGRGPDPNIYGPTPYAYKQEYAPMAQRVENLVGPLSVEELAAVFFQGHVELIGLSPRGVELAPLPDGMRGSVTVPEGVTTVEELAERTGVARGTLLEANPGVEADDLPPRMNVPGWWEHMLLVLPDGTRESPAQIAAQHGVTEQALRAANPGLRWNELPDGFPVLVRQA